MAKSFTQILYKIHSWLGLFNGLWLIILGLSGSMLVYYQEIDRWINKDILTVEQQGQRLPVDSLYAIIRTKYPNASGTSIMWLPKKATDCYSFRVYDNAEKKDIYYSWDLYQADINPYTGAIVRAGNYRDFFSFLHWLLTFHYCLQMGTPGMLVITIAGILLFVNIITGIILYRKHFLKAMMFRAPVQWKNWRTGTSGLHRYIGVWSLFFNIVIFYSGLLMNWTVFDNQTWVAPKPQPKNIGAYASIDRMIHQVDSVYPGLSVKYVYIPFNKSFDGYINEENVLVTGNIPGTPTIFPDGSSQVSFNPNSGKIVKTKNINESIKTMNLLEKWHAVAYSFHIGSFAGTFSRILYLFIGISPALLAVSGFILWWRRARRKPAMAMQEFRRSANQ